MGAEPPGAFGGQDEEESSRSRPLPPPQMRQLDFLLGSVNCVGKQRPDGAEATVMFMRTTPILAGHYYQTEGTWPGALVRRIFGWNPVDSVFTEFYFADSGSHGTASSPGWQNGELVMTGSLAIAGKGVLAIRDVFTVVDEDRFTIDSHLRSGERWVPVEQFVCHRYQRLDGSPAATLPDF